MTQGPETAEHSLGRGGTRGLCSCSSFRQLPAVQAGGVYPGTEGFVLSTWKSCSRKGPRDAEEGTGSKAGAEGRGVTAQVTGCGRGCRCRCARPARRGQRTHSALRCPPENAGMSQEGEGREKLPGEGLSPVRSPMETPLPPALGISVPPSRRVGMRRWVGCAQGCPRGSARCPSQVVRGQDLPAPGRGAAAQAQSPGSLPGPRQRERPGRVLPLRQVSGFGTSGRRGRGLCSPRFGDRAIGPPSCVLGKG